LPQCPKTADEPASEHRDSWVSQIIGVQFQIIAIAVFDNSIIRHYEPPIGNFLREHINIAQKDAIGGHGILRSRNCGIKGKATMRRDSQLALPEISRPQKLARLAIQAADFYRGSLRALTPAVLADMDTDFPWSVYCQYWTACFDAAAFFEYSKKAFADAEVCARVRRDCARMRAL
jgi:hypothetical protein